MELLAKFISNYPVFFETYGNIVLIALIIGSIVLDRLLQKRKFKHKVIKYGFKVVLFFFTFLLGSMLFMINWPLKPMVTALAKVESNIGQPIEDFQFINVRDSNTHKISDFKGRVILLNFWATYCAPCLKELPYLKKIEDDYRDGVSVIALTDEDYGRIKKFFQRFDIPTMVGSFTFSAWIDLQSFRPVTVIIDRNGVVRDYVFGRQEYIFFQNKIEKYL